MRYIISQAPKYYLEQSDDGFYWIYDAEGYSETGFSAETPEQAQEIFITYVISNPETVFELLKSDRTKGNSFCVEIMHYTSIDLQKRLPVRIRTYRIVHNRKSVFSQNCNTISEQEIFEKYESYKKEQLGN
jgi:hypothetical protein